MAKYIIEIDVANADDDTLRKINKALYYGTAQEALKEAGIDVAQIAVRRNNEAPMLTEGKLTPA